MRDKIITDLKDDDEIAQLWLTGQSSTDKSTSTRRSSWLMAHNWRSARKSCAFAYESGKQSTPKRTKFDFLEMSIQQFRLVWHDVRRAANTIIKVLHGWAHESRCRHFGCSLIIQGLHSKPNSQPVSCHSYSSHDSAHLKLNRSKQRRLSVRLETIPQTKSDYHIQ